MDPAIQNALRVAKSVMPSMGAPAMADGGVPRRGRKPVAAQMDGPSVDDHHPSWIPTRLITSKRAVFNPNDRNVVDMAALRATPDVFQHNVDLVRAYPNVTKAQARMGHDKLSNAFMDHVVSNLLWLHDKVPPETRQRSQLWYDGARKITDDWSRKFNLPDHSIAGALAALSPQKDWYQNVSLAERVLHAMRGEDGRFYQNFSMSPEMEERLKQIPSMNKAEYEPIFNAIRGKSLSQIDAMNGFDADEKAELKSFWIRLHDEAHHDKGHRIVTPEGGFGDYVTTAKGARSGIGWGSLGEISKAIRSIEAADNPAMISDLMGERHKVRNFYNNILSPNSPNGDVTIDTHAVAAGLLRPLSGNSLEVSHNFKNYPGKDLPTARGSAITGIQGLYPLYADAYREAAKQRGILPRQMQSITWEAVRGLFPDTFKTKANNDRIDSVWSQHRNGKIDQDEARRQINEIAGGIRPPTWTEEVSRQPDAQIERASDAGNIPQSGIYGSPTETFERRARGGAASGLAQKGLHPEGLMRLHPAMNIPGVHIRTAEAGEPIFRGGE